MNDSDLDAASARNQPEPSSADPVNWPEELRAMMVGASWTGPLPPPQALQRYDEILPGGADRIFKMAEDRHQHQIDQEKAAISLEKDALSSAGESIAAENSRSKLGLVFAFIIALAGIGTGAWLTAVGKAGFGMAFVFGPLVGLAAVFVYGTHARQSERRRMAEEDSDD